MKAEEQALIAGLKAVPKAERHRLREIPTEEAYKDWRLRLAGERLEAAAGEVERLYEEMDAQRRSLVESEAYWREVTGADGDDTAAWVTDAAGGLASRLAAAEQVWLERCLEWYEIYEGEF